MAARETVSQAEFARQVGCTKVWICKLVKQGKLPVNENKQIYLAEGFAAYEQMTKEKADKAKASKKKKLVEKDTTASFAGAKNITEAFNKARLAEKTYQAKLKEIEYKLKRGDLIESEKVKADAHQTAAALRARLVSIPVRIAGLCEGRPAREIEEIIEDAINDALTEFQKSEFLTDDETVG